MSWLNRKRERERFYLLPGMGGRAARAKHLTMLKWSVAIGLLVSLVLAAILYLTNGPGQ